MGFKQMQSHFFFKRRRVKSLKSKIWSAMDCKMVSMKTFHIILQIFLVCLCVNLHISFKSFYWGLSSANCSPVRSLAWSIAQPSLSAPSPHSARPAHPVCERERKLE